MTTRTPVVSAPRIDPEGVLAGSPAAQRLHLEVCADPGRTLRVDLVAPGGFGKTVLLDTLEVAYRDSGASVRRVAPPADQVLGPAEVLLVDDAHLLPPAELARLTSLASKPGVRMVVAHRPWPRTAEMEALSAALTTDREPVVLDVLAPSGVAARAMRVLRVRPPADLVELVLTQSAGLPALVDRLVATLVEQGAAAGPGRIPPGWQPPAGLLAEVAYAVRGLGPDVSALLLACALGAPLDADVLAPLLGLTGPGGAREDAAASARSGLPAVEELTEAARAAGLLGPDGRPAPLVAAAVLARSSEVRCLEVRRALAEIEVRRGGSVLTAALGLLATGATGDRAAEVFEAGGDEAARTASPAVGDLYDAAVRAGAPALGLAARRAEAALVADDLDRALAHAERVLSAVDQLPAADAARAGAVAAAVLARRGLLSRSAELYRWMATASIGSPALIAVPALVGTGALAEARAILDVPERSTPGRPPTLLAGAEELMAHGVYDSVAGSPTAALSQLARAAALLEASDRAVLLPDSPAALAALVAIQCGELEVARSVLERATQVRLGGPGAAVRHRLLMGWIALYRGANASARAVLAAAAPSGARLEPRDELLAAALEVALAHRSGDRTALMTGWTRAREAIVHHPVDLFVLQPLGELAIAAARLREQSWVRPHLDEAAVLLEQLGDPLLWAAPLHWAGVHAAMFDATPKAAERHVAALEAGASTSRYAAAMAAGARQWLRVLDGDVDADAVEAAARRLHVVGLTWDGGKLAGQAAIRTRDKKAMSSLLACARALQSRAPAEPPLIETGRPETPIAGAAVATGAAAVTPTPSAASFAAAASSSDDRDGPLSDREREVAALVLEGLTYKQIGERLFISAKTVEHHVARMRQRLGSESRGELFSHLRAIVGSATAAD